jgi:glycine cleavage system H protein
MGSDEKGNLVPEELKYTEDHEWILFEDDNTGLCGLTDHAQHSLGDIVFVEFISNIENAVIEKKDTVAIIESPKAASDIYSPVSGTVFEINRDLEDAPETINSDPYGKGWIFRIKIKDTSELDTLMNADQYTDYIKSEA